MTKEWRNIEKVRSDARLGILDDNVEKYVQVKMCYCERNCPQSYSTSRFDLMREGIKAVMYREIESCIEDLQHEFTIGFLIGLMVEKGIIYDKIYWVDHHIIRQILHVMNCEGKLTSRIELQRNEAKPKSKPIMVQLFKYISHEPNICPYRQENADGNLVCKFNFRQDGKKITRAELEGDA